MQRIIALQPTRATAATADYPDGSAKNETAPGANDGTPFELARDNDVFGMQQALLHQLGITPSGNAETALLSDFLGGVRRLVSRGVFFVDSGAANAYVLAKATGLQANTVLYDTMEIEFKAANVNTGASTVNPDGIGAKALTLPNGTALSGGEVPGGTYSTARYNLASDRFELILPEARGRFVSAEFDYDLLTIKSFVHGLGVVPARVQIRGRCISAELGYAANDYAYNITFDDLTDRGSFTVGANITNVFAALGDSAPRVIDIVAGAGADVEKIAPAKWKFVIIAEA